MAYHNQPNDPIPANLPEGSLRILQITDPHLYADPNGTLLSLNTRESLNAVIDKAMQTFWPADMVLATGDLVHDHSQAGYDSIHASYSRMGLPTYCIPGNHDTPEIMRKCLTHDSMYTIRDLQQGNWSIIFLDSSMRDSEGGALSQRELNDLETSLASHPDKHTMITLHHQAVEVGSKWMDTMALENADAFFEIVDRHPQVKVILWGHIHQCFQGERKGVQLLGTPSTCIQFKPLEEDFALDDVPPGFRWLALLPDGGLLTGVERLDTIPGEIDFTSIGY